MAEWSVNNRACTTTWSTLRVLGQIPKGLTFGKAGGRRMEQLTFWSIASTPEMRQLQAESLAVMMDNVFIMVRGARYEPGGGPAGALEAIAAAMLEAKGTITDLAAINDEHYRFWQEGDDA